MNLLAIQYADALPFKSQAARDGVSISDTKQTDWWAWGDPLDFIGVCGAIMTSRGARIKGVWVRPASRRQGHGGAMTLELIRVLTEERMICYLEALAMNPGFYEALGWKRLAQPRPNGAVLVGRAY